MLRLRLHLHLEVALGAVARVVEAKPARTGASREHERLRTEPAHADRVRKEVSKISMMGQ